MKILLAVAMAASLAGCSALNPWPDPADIGPHTRGGYGPMPQYQPWPLPSPFFPSTTPEKPDPIGDYMAKQNARQMMREEIQRHEREWWRRYP